ncbi:hypothetical protein [Butyrivibrio sp. WCD2001]|nr:hypothetical protein [Butyrivibrio sp. WCD2001]
MMENEYYENIYSRTIIPGIVTGIPFAIGVCFVAYLLFLGMLDVMGMRG